MVFETTSQLHKPVIPTRSQKVGPKIKSVVSVMSFSGLPKVLKDLLLSFAGHKCEACGTYDESIQCNDCKKHFCFEENLHDDIFGDYCADAPLCKTCITTYFKTCQNCDTFQLPNISGCCHCDRRYVCTTCLNYTYQGPACGKCFEKWSAEEYHSW